MAAIQYNGNYLELPASFTISIERYSGYFETELRADLTLPINLPYENSPVNRAALRDLDIPQAILQSESVFVLFEYTGRFFLAKMVFRELYETLQVNLYFDKTEFKAFSKRLPDFSIPNGKSLAQLYADGINLRYPETDCYFPMLWAKDLYDDPSSLAGDDPNNPNYRGLINAHNRATDYLYENYLDVNQETFNINTAIPMVALMKVLEVGFAADGYALRGEFYESAQERALFLVNNQTLDERDSPTIYQDTFGKRNAFNYYDPVWQNPIILSYTTVANAAIQNNQEYLCAEEGNFEFRFRATEWYVAGEFTLEIVHEDTNGAETIIKSFTKKDNNVPAINAFGNLAISAANGLLNGKVFVRISLFKGKNLEEPGIGLKDYTFSVIRLNKPLLNFRNPTDLASHLPDVTFADLVSAVITGRCLQWSVDIERREVRLNYRPSVSTKAIQDLTSSFTEAMRVKFQGLQKTIVYYQAESEIQKTREVDNIYKTMLQVDENGNVELLSELPQNFAGELISLANKPLLEIEDLFSFYPFSFTTLHYGRRGISVAAYNDGDPKLEGQIRFAYFRRDSQDLPVATNTLNGASLWLTTNPGDTGNFWGTWLSIEKRDNRFFQLQFLMTSNQLDQLDLSRPVAVNKVPYVIKSLEADIDGSADHQKVWLILKRL